MNPTPNQITECDDENVLCEWAAVYCMGYVKGENSLGDKCYRRGSAFIYHYEPTSPTEKGKAQAIDLAVKYGFNISMPYDATDTALVETMTGIDFEDFSWQISVVKAALLSAIGE